MKLTREQAHDIALDAMELKTFYVTDFAGYYGIWDNEEISYYVAVNKACDDDGNQYFAVYYSSDIGECEWEFTSALDVDELVDLLMDIVERIEQNEIQVC